jgi:hypothetical protein
VRIALAVLAAAALLPPPPEPAITGLDHIPIAVRDLARASDDYRALGFALKPGRPHDNGIQNQHVKFTDGTELELITAPEARDALTKTYRQHLEKGDGPAFLALFAPRRAYADERLRGTALPSYVFLAGRNTSPTDLPEHFAHANTAQSFVRVWLAGDDLSRERRLLAAAGATFADTDVFVPDRVHATVARLQEGDVVFLEGTRQVVAGRPVAGATLRVGSLDTARKILDHGQPRPLPVVTSPDGRSVFLPPSRTHGLWLEFRDR